VKNRKSIYTAWRRSDDEYGTFVNDKGDSAVFLFKTIAIVNGEVLFGDDLFRKLSELANK
jgi:hypothetical protein